MDDYLWLAAFHGGLPEAHTHLRGQPVYHHLLQERPTCGTRCPMEAYLWQTFPIEDYLLYTWHYRGLLVAPTGL